MKNIILYIVIFIFISCGDSSKDPCIDKSLLVDINWIPQNVDRSVYSDIMYRSNGDFLENRQIVGSWDSGCNSINIDMSVGVGFSQKIIHLDNNTLIVDLNGLFEITYKK